MATPTPTSEAQSSATASVVSGLELTESLRRIELGASRKWEDLPSDCLANIFERVGMKSLILNVPLVCTTWYTASLNPNCWEILDFSSFTVSERVVPGMVKLAVKRSHFLATKFVIVDSFFDYNFLATKLLVLDSFFDSEIDDVLHCISEGCPALKILDVSVLPSYTPQYIQKWKDLEFLRIGRLSCPAIFTEVVEQISIHCKNFVGLSAVCSCEVSVIAAIIPNIKYLSLRRSHVKRDDLILLLSKCRDLVSLDVTDCIGFDSDDTEITQMASHITTFLSQGSFSDDDDVIWDYYSDHDPVLDDDEYISS